MKRTLICPTVVTCLPEGVDIRPGRLVKYIKGEGDKVTVTLDDQQTVTGDHLSMSLLSPFFFF
jgi:hypothetical protein